MSASLLAVRAWAMVASGHSSVKMCRLLSMESLELVQKGTMVLPAKS